MNRYIDHTALKSTTTPADIHRLCQEAIQWQFRAVCVNSRYVAQVADELKDQPDIAVCSVVGFPLGSMSIAALVNETIVAVADGAQEIDMVINVGNLDSATDDIRDVVEAAGNAHVKVIIECCLLSDAEKIEACQAVVAAGAAFVKTSTGFSSGGATLHDVALLRANVPPSIGVKAAGGIRDLSTARALIAAGATRIGASAGVAIMKEEQSNAVASDV